MFRVQTLARSKSQLGFHTDVTLFAVNNPRKLFGHPDVS